MDLLTHLIRKSNLTSLKALFKGKRVPTKGIEAIIAESLKVNYRDKLHFPNGTGIYYQRKTVKCTIDDTNTRKLKLKNYPLAILYNFCG